MSLFFVFVFALDGYLGKTHTMLGPNPRKAVGTPTSSSTEFPQKTAITPGQSTNGGLMVKAMDEIFRHVEEAEHPNSFKVIQIQFDISFRLL